MIAYFVKQLPHLTLSEFAKDVKRYLSSLSKPIREIELRSKTDAGLKALLDKIHEKIYAEIPKSQV